MKSKLRLLLSALFVFGLLMLVWQSIVMLFGVQSYMLPTPWRVAKTVGNRLPDLWAATFISAEAAVGGLVASIVVGVVIALAFARSQWVRTMFFPYTILLQTVPVIAITPLMLMWIGQGMLSVGVVTFIICLPPIIANTTQGLISVDENLVQLFMMHNASQSQILRKLRLPHSFPYLFVGLRISSGIAVVGAITGELFAGSGQVGHGGIGYSIVYAQTQVQTDYLFALVIAATALGFSLFFTVTFFEWLALHKWHESAVDRRIEG